MKEEDAEHIEPHENSPGSVNNKQQGSRQHAHTPNTQISQASTHGKSEKMGSDRETDTELHNVTTLFVVRVLSMNLLIDGRP